MKDRVTFIKYDGSPHYNFSVHEIYRNEKERWVYSTAGTDLYKGEKLVGKFPNAALQRIPLGQPSQETWIFRIDADGNRSLEELYINLILPLQAHGDRIVDMDIDVVVSPDGRAQMVDIDEFKENALLMVYPEDVRQFIEGAAADLVKGFSDFPNPLSLIPPEVRAAWEAVSL